MQRWQVGGLTALALCAGIIGGVIGTKLAQPPGAASAPSRAAPYSVGSYAAPSYAAPARSSASSSNVLSDLLKDPSSARPVPSIADRLQRDAEQADRERMQRQLDQQKQQLRDLEIERERQQARDATRNLTGSLFDKYNAR